MSTSMTDVYDCAYDLFPDGHYIRLHGMGVACNYSYDEATEHPRMVGFSLAGPWHYVLKLTGGRVKVWMCALSNAGRCAVYCMMNLCYVVSHTAQDRAQSKIYTGVRAS